MKLSQETGLVIQSLDTGRCVEVDMSRYLLVWSSACDQTWELRSVPIDRNPVSGCKKTTVQLKNTNKCISLLNEVQLQVLTPKAFLNSCKSAEEKWDQILLLCFALESFERDGMWSLMQYLPRRDSITLGSILSLNPNLTLSRIRLSTVNELKDLTKVGCRDVKAENGTALLDVSVPVFLPGERITVECDEGFGVRGDNETYENRYFTTCSDHMDLEQCSPLPKQREQKCFNLDHFERTGTSDSDRDLGTFLLVIVGLTLFLDH